MWYLIKDIRNSWYAVRYYKSTDKLPAVILDSKDGDLLWTTNLALFTELSTCIFNVDFFSIDEMTIIGAYTFTPIPGIPSNINPITAILEIYPELFI